VALLMVEGPTNTCAFDEKNRTIKIRLRVIFNIIV
jgi:hypothetical protein